MKLSFAHKPPKQLRDRPRARAFTLTEMMTTMAVFLLVIIAMISMNTFGYRMSAKTGCALTSVAYGLSALDSIRDEVRGANSVQIGNGTGTLFTATGSVGNTLKIYPTTNNNSWLEVYLNTNAQALYLLNGSNSSPYLIASGITNRSAFQMMNYQGSTVTNTQGRYAVAMTLQFSQIAYQLPSNVWDYFTLQATMTPRSQN